MEMAIDEPRILPARFQCQKPKSTCLLRSLKYSTEPLIWHRLRKTPSGRTFLPQKTERSVFRFRHPKGELGRWAHTLSILLLLACWGVADVSVWLRSFFHLAK